MADNFFKIAKGLTLKANTAPSNPEEGDIYYNSSSGRIELYENGSWRAVADVNSIQTFQNKVIDSSNTITAKDSTFTFQNAGQSSNTLAIDMQGNAGNVGTLEVPSTASRTWTLPNATTDLVGHNVAQTLSQKTIQAPYFSDLTQWNELGPVGTPDTGRNFVYFKTDGKFYRKDDAGTETEIGGAGALDDLSDVTITSPVNDHVLKYSGGSWINAVSPGGGGGGGMSLGNLDGTGDDNPLTTNTHYLCDSSGGAFTVNLPAGAADSIIRLSDSTDSWKDFNVTVSANGSEEIDGTTDDLVLDVKGSWVQFMWDADNSEWKTDDPIDAGIPGEATDAYVTIPQVVTTEWTAWTPSNTQGFGTISSNNLQYKRVGDTMFIEGDFTAGTTVNSEAQIELPDSLTIGGSGSLEVLVGKILRDANSPHTYTVLATPGDSFLNFAFTNAGSANNATTPQNGSSIFVTGERLTFHATIPISEWSNTEQTQVTTTVQQTPMTEWTAYTPTTQGFGTISSDDVEYKRVGDTLWIRGHFTNGTVAASEARLGLPSGLTISAPGTTTNMVGKAVRDSSHTQLQSAVLLATDGDTYLNYGDHSSGVGNNPTSPINGNGRFNSSERQTFWTGPIQVAEWIGSTVSVSNSRVEYASTSGTWNADDSTTSYGPGGAAMGGSLGSPRSKTVTWSSPVQSTDVIIVQGSKDQITWVDMNSCMLGSGNDAVTTNSSSAAPNAGVHSRPGATAYETVVVFQEYMSRANDDSPVVNWPSSQAYWRVVKSANPLAVTNSPVLPSAMTDSDATALGHKRYQHNTSYNGGNSPTLTLTGGGGSLSSTEYSAFIPYQTQDGDWRLKFNFSVIVSTTTRTAISFAVQGVQIASAAGSDGHAVSAACEQVANNQLQLWNDGNDRIQMNHGSVSSSRYMFSGDVPLDVKPNWAY